MVTGKSPDRQRLAQASLRSFVEQRWPNRLLVLVNDGDFDLDLSGIPADRAIVIHPSDKRSLGELRNLGLDAIPDGALWTYWDDDDWHHPHLLAAQHRLLESLGLRACILQNQVKYSFVSGAAFVDRQPRGFAGTLMTYNRRDLRFPEWARAEDTAYWGEVMQREQVPWDNPPHFFLRFFHGANRGTPAISDLQATQPRARLPRAASYLRQVLAAYDGEDQPDVAMAPQVRPAAMRPTSSISPGYREVVGRPLASSNVSSLE